MTANAPAPKEAHEEGVCRRFLTACNANFGTEYQFSRLQKPPAPDCLCTDNLNIEVVTAYAHQQLPKLMWDRVRGIVTGSSDVHFIAGPDAQAYAAIDHCIAQKATKAYTYRGDLWLLIDVEAPLLEFEDLEADYLHTPRGLPQGPFQRIWILLRDADGDKIGQVTL